MTPFPLVWQAPTGSVAGPELCAAVSAAGGVGAMGLTWSAEPDVRQAIRQVRSQTSALFQANYVLTMPPETLDAALDEGLPMVTFSWGDASTYVERVRSAGALLGIQVVNREGARRAMDLGPDFLIAQGIEAGGHVQSSMPLRRLLSLLADIEGVPPIVAAGGLATAEDLREVQTLGASGAMFGTRFVATQESRAHPLYRSALVQHTETALTLCFQGGWEGANHRVIRNSTLETWEAAGSPVPGARPGERETVAHASDGSPIPRYEQNAPRFDTTGNIEAMCMYAGMGVDQIDDIPSAAEVVRRLLAPP